MASHRRSPQPGRSRVTPLAVIAAGSAAVAAVSSTSGAYAVPRDDLADVRAKIDRLYAQAESATDQFNAAKERRNELEQQVGRLQDAVARGQDRLNRIRSGLGGIATAQYRSGTIDPALQLLLSSRPEDFLDRAAVLDRLGNRRIGQLRRIEHAQRTVDQRRTEAKASLAELETTREELAAVKRRVQSQLAGAQRLLDGLPPELLARLDRMSAAGRASRAGLPAPDPLDLPAWTSRAEVAVAAARQAVGSPYRWGSAGPHAFDCSGLTYWAYQRAGVTLPRTSQGQLRAGRRVPLSQARPGDLVIYRDDASHVGMYVGHGQVVHAPYPGAKVRYDRVDMMPITSVTRV